MATVEFLQERVAKATQKIEKLNGTIAKYQAKVEKKYNELTTKFGLTSIIDKWEARDKFGDDAYYLIYDIEATITSIKDRERDLRDTQLSLNKYQNELIKAVEKANSRDIKPILDALAYWREKVTEWYQETFAKFPEWRDEWCAVDREYTQYINSHYIPYLHRKTDVGFLAIKKKRNDAKALFNERAGHLLNYIECDKFDWDKLSKDLQRESDAKYDDIVDRTNAIVGQITDASNLYVGLKGDLNGYIIGTRGKAKVETISAGGYNIQCYHFRTLIHKMN